MLQNFVVMWSETIEEEKFGTQRVVIRTLVAFNMLCILNETIRGGDECEHNFLGGGGRPVRTP